MNKMGVRDINYDRRSRADLAKLLFYDSSSLFDSFSDSNCGPFATMVPIISRPLGKYKNEKDISDYTGS